VQGFTAAIAFTCGLSTLRARPPRLHRLPHRALDQLAHPRDAAGQPAGVPCMPLDAQGRCRLFERPERATGRGG